jgi:hypothetical protein
MTTKSGYQLCVGRVLGIVKPRGDFSVRAVMKFQRSNSVPNLVQIPCASSKQLASASEYRVYRERRNPESPHWERYRETETPPGTIVKSGE